MSGYMLPKALLSIFSHWLISSDHSNLYVLHGAIRCFMLVARTGETVLFLCWYENVPLTFFLA